MQALLVICDAQVSDDCKRTAVFRKGSLKANRRQAVRQGWRHNRARDEIVRIWWCPKCHGTAAAERKKQTRASDNDRDD